MTLPCVTMRAAYEQVPLPRGADTQVSAGQYCSYFVRSDGKVDRTEGWGKVNKTISPDMDPSKGDCVVM